MIYVHKDTKYYEKYINHAKKIIYFIYTDIINKNISISSNQNSNLTSYKKRLSQNEMASFVSAKK